MTIIDARLRPPLKDYLRCNLYRDPKKTQGWSNNFLMKVSPPSNSATRTCCTGKWTTRA